MFNYICTENEKKNAFKGGDAIRRTITVDNKIIEQVNFFNYLGNLISYENRMDNFNKIK
jgi:hypothetical protein